ncbi:hypothetical protein H7J07_05945 [Mycobacterium koreense]|nr:hypothetical protein [Mycolicibacillus koreensis]MCV7247768.1 hypothetical protein [Mycolicibacillus koreensis]BBY54151.1 hypothetical protein MKOR_14020 [Mycolicibacillus koreensis]
MTDETPRGYSREVRIAAAKVAVAASEQTGDHIPDEVRELATEESR